MVNNNDEELKVIENKKESIDHDKHLKHSPTLRRKRIQIIKSN